MPHEFTPIEVIVARILTIVEKRRASLRSVMEEYFIKNQRESIARGVVRAFSVYLLKRYRILDMIIKDVLGRNINNLPIYEKNLLRSLIYETKFRDIKMSRILKISKKLKNLDLSKKDIVLVKKISIKDLLSEYRGIERIGIEYSLPNWIVEYLVKILGKPNSFKLFKKFNKKPDLWIRTNTLMIKPEELLRRLSYQGIVAKRDNIFPEALKIIRYKENLTHLEEYVQGLFYIQDKSSLLVGYALDADRWDTVWDMCSAPGGKSTHLYQLMNKEINIYSTEWKKKRIKLMKKILNTLKHYGIYVILSDSEFPPFRTKFDRIVIDPDCSSLGRLGQSPEIRLWIKKEMINTFQKNQRKLIEIASEYIKRSGTIIYSTCTLTTEENEENMIWALQKFSFSLEEILPRIGLPGLMGLDKTVRLYPHIHSTTGFFIAKMRY